MTAHVSNVKRQRHVQIYKPVEVMSIKMDLCLTVLLLTCHYWFVSVTQHWRATLLESRSGMALQQSSGQHYQAGGCGRCE